MKFEAYCLKTKKKEEVLKPVVVKSEKGRYMVKGVDAAGNKLSLIINEATALAAVKAKIKKEGF